MKYLSDNDFNDNLLESVPDGVNPQDAVNKRQLDNRQSKPDLLSHAKYPMYISHRNSPRLYPEESMEGQRIVAEQGFPIEIDVMALSDGTLVGCHDVTVDRTMENIGVGNVSSKTVKQWENARIKPAIKGGKTGTPIFFEEWLDEFGGRYILVPELKQTASSHSQAFIDAIKKRGLEESVIVQSFDFNVAADFAAQGLHSVYLFTATPAETPAQIAAAGIEFASGNKNMTQATISSLKAAGLKVIMYTTNTISEADNALSMGCDAVFSDDPQYVSRRLPRRSSDPYSEGYGWPGMKGMRSGAGTDGQTHSLYWLEGDSLAMTAGGSEASSVSQDWAGKIQRPFRISFDVEVSPDPANDTPLFSNAIVLWTNSIDPDDPYYDTARPGQEGFVFAIRNNGRLQTWKYVNGAAALSIGSTPVLGDSNVVSSDGKTSKISLTVEATEDKITLYSPSHGMLGSWDDSFSPDPMRMALRTATFGKAKFSNVEVLQGDEMGGESLATLTDKPYDTGWNGMSITGSVVTPYGSASDNKYRRVGSTVEVVGQLGTTGTSLPNGTVFATLPVGFRPQQNYVSRQQGSGSDSWCLRVETNGNCIAERYGPSTVTANRWLPFSGSFFID